MIRVTPLAAVLALTAAAFADLPPPPEEYAGPRHATLAGLDFEHRFSHYSRVIRLHRNETFVLLVGCEGTSANCDAVTKAGVIDWRVVSVDGKPVEGGDLQAVIDAFAAGRGPVVVLFVHSEANQPPAQRTLKLERK